MGFRGQRFVVGGLLGLCGWSVGGGTSEAGSRRQDFVCKSLQAGIMGRFFLSGALQGGFYRDWALQRIYGSRVICGRGFAGRVLQGGGSSDDLQQQGST